MYTADRERDREIDRRNGICIMYICIRTDLLCSRGTHRHAEEERAMHAHTHKTILPFHPSEFLFLQLLWSKHACGFACLLACLLACMHASIWLHLFSSPLIIGSLCSSLSFINFFLFTFRNGNDNDDLRQQMSSKQYSGIPVSHFT